MLQCILLVCCRFKNMLMWLYSIFACDCHQLAPRGATYLPANNYYDFRICFGIAKRSISYFALPVHNWQIYLQSLHLLVRFWFTHVYIIVVTSVITDRVFHDGDLYSVRLSKSHGARLPVCWLDSGREETSGRTIC